MPGPGSGPLPGTLKAEELPGAEAAATLYQTAIPVGLAGPRVELVVLDTAAFERVVAGTPADPSLPPELLAEGGESPIPAIVKTFLPISICGFKTSRTALLVRVGAAGL